MSDISSVCYVLSAALGIAGFWVDRLVGPAVAALALGFLLTGR